MPVEGRRFVAHYLPMLIVRLVLLVIMVITGRAVSLWPVFLVECASLYYGTVNAKYASAVAEGWRGWFTTGAYFAGVFLLPRPGAFLPAYVVSAGYWASFALSAWALWHLRECFTYGAPTFVKVVTSGPYRFLRHPQLMARLLIEYVILLSNPVGWCAARCLVAGALTLSVMLVEDRWRTKYCPKTA